MRTSLKLFIVTTVVFCGFAAVSPLFAQYNVYNTDGSINTGNFSMFTVLTSSDLNDYNNTETGPSIITGNVGIGGHGNFSMSDGQLNGDLYMNNYGTLSVSGPAYISGHRHGKRIDQGEDGIDETNTLNAALADADALEAAAAALPNSTAGVQYQVTQGSFTQGQSVNISNPAGNITIADQNPFGGSKIVLSINNFVLSNGTFELHGSATTTYVLNISGQFNINNSQVIATGGLLASHILFNFYSSNTTTVTMQQGTTLTGILLADGRNVDLSGGKVFGRVVASQLTLTSGGQVISQ
jgi:hypothetical protein